MVHAHVGKSCQALAECPEVALFVFDLEGRCIQWSDYAVGFLGRSPAELATSSFADVMMAEDRERVCAALCQCLARLEPVPGLVARCAVDGQVKHVSIRCLPVCDERKRPSGVLASLVDVTALVGAQELQRLQGLYRSVLNAEGFFMVRVDGNGRRTFVSDYTVKVSGIPKKKWLGMPYGSHMVDPREREQSWRAAQGVFVTGKPARGHVTRHMWKGTEKHLMGSMDPIKDENGNVVEVLLTSTDVTEQVGMQKRLELYTAKVAKAHEEERRRLSRFLHDDTIQALVAVSAGMQRFLNRVKEDRRNGNDVKHVELLEQANTTVQDQIDALRRLSTTLRPALLDRMGLAAAIEWFVEQACGPEAVKSSVRVGKGWRRLGPTAEVGLFRIVQEAVNNALRHGHPQNVNVTLDIADGLVELTIEDDGQGFSPPRSHFDLLSKGKLGLLGIEEGARELGAELDIRARPGKGAVIAVRCSLKRLKEQELEEQDISETHQAVRLRSYC